MKRPQPTPEQARTRTRQRQAQKEHEHRHCEMIAQPRGPHWGLYCAAHGTWIQWIPAAVARGML
jgi:hypothetical protein